MIDFRRLLRSFCYAARGLKYIYQAEQNFRLQLLGALIVILAGYFLHISRRDWVVLILLITSVLVLEILNTAFEKFLDIIKPKIHHYVEAIKDLLAMMVLLTSLSALVIGIIVFYPYLHSLLFD